MRFTFGRKVQRIGRSNPRRRDSCRSSAVRSAAFSFSASASPGSGRTSGFVTKMFGSTSLDPANARRTLKRIRRRSRRLALGRRMAMELTQRIRFFFERIRMMCVLLVGSPSQSCAKQMIEAPSSTSGFHGHLAPYEEPVPRGEHGQREELLAQVLVTRLLPREERIDFPRVKERRQARRREKSTHRCRQALPEPLREWDREALLRPRQDLGWHDIVRRPPEYVLPRATAQLEVGRQSPRPLDQGVIEERDPQLDGGGHRGLVRLHEKIV